MDNQVGRKCNKIYPIMSETVIGHDNSEGVGLELFRAEKLQEAIGPYYDDLRERTGLSLARNVLADADHERLYRLHQAKADIEFLELFGGFLPCQQEESGPHGARNTMRSEDLYTMKLMQSHSVRCDYGINSIFAIPLGAKRLGGRSEVLLLGLPNQQDSRRRGTVFSALLSNDSWTAIEEFKREQLRKEFTDEQVQSMSSKASPNIFILPAEGVPEIRLRRNRPGEMGTESGNLRKIQRLGIRVIPPKEAWGFGRDGSGVMTLRRATPEGLVDHTINYAMFADTIIELSAALNVQTQLKELIAYRDAKMCAHPKHA